MSERRYPAPHPPYADLPADHRESPRPPRGGPAGNLTPAAASAANGRSLSASGAPIPAAGRWEWNPRTDELRCDEAALAVLGIDPAAYDGRVETWFKAVHPDDLPGVLAERDNAIRTRGTFTAEYRVGRPDGSLGWVTECGHVLPAADGLPALVVGAIWDTGHAAPAGRAVRFMSDGFLVLDGEWRIGFANVAAERLLGGYGGLTGRSLPEVCPQVEAAEWERHRRTLATGAPAEVSVWMPGARRWYRLRLVGVLDGVAGGRAPAYTAHITDFTDHMAVIAERTAAERAAAGRTARIRELTGALAEAMTVQDVVDAVARHVLPPFGATGFHVNFVVGDHLQSAGSVGYTTAFVDEVRRLPLASRYPLPDAIRERALRFITSAEEYVALYPHLSHIPPRGRKNAWVFIPLIASGHVFGGCAISFTHPRRFTDEERSLLTAISGLLSQALARARIYDAERARARELQRALLPRKLPALPAVTVAARYLPAGKDMEVGGDWYDIIPLSADRVALVIGDVMGHGVSEAATMGRLRTALHTLAGLELPPDEILTHLNDIVAGLGDDFYATCLYIVYDPTNNTCVFASAGHPPPALILPDGDVRFPGDDPDPPLGAATPPFTTTEMHLPEGSVLVLYTDGLVESATLDIDHGTATLAGVLKQWPCRPHVPVQAGEDAEICYVHHDDDCLNRLCDSLISALLPAEQPSPDDAALLVVRTHTMGPDRVASWPLPDDPIAARKAREHVRAQLAAWDLDALSMTTELLASELVGNVIRHAKGPINLRLLRGQVLTCEVSDGSPTTPRVRRASETDEGGRGLQLIAAIAQRWGTRYTPDGKCIWTEQPFPSELSELAGFAGLTLDDLTDLDEAAGA